MVISKHTARPPNTPNGLGAVVSATPLETPLDLTIPENDMAREAAVLDGVAK